jgi:hypothetical protein
VLYSAQREVATNIVVQMVKYQVQDAEFNETILNFKGQANYSSMIKKICEYGSRTEFILTILNHILTSEPHRQIMILAHNKSVLTYLYDAIYHRKMASVGYYIGGMNQSDLNETETKQAICKSESLVDSVEHIFCPIPQTGKYKIRVQYRQVVNPVIQPYALSWWTAPTAFVE